MEEPCSIFKISCHDDKWLDKTTQLVQHLGLAIIEDILDHDFCQETKVRMYSVKNIILNEVGAHRLKQAGELGQLRLMMKVDPFFAQFLEIPRLLHLIDEILSPTAIMHLQNGFILQNSITPHLDSKIFACGALSGMGQPMGIGLWDVGVEPPKQ